ncbi:hypothetical protein GJA_1278 [Janthinobacterium agaricidamnosum NBRC 102515 = DSM 9628]|uniref:Uncharacterized protein n=1 Tax=Janthinobacterium agaricidamnosum NBRC 102515 = DSM 9628 TaxID=1349767 RepID=W0V262_9BURK|nr:hypothetical protein GJA_1278 [Janthinobacterium agaricidamnosum NBRC 102515 = DSM 9628]
MNADLTFCIFFQYFSKFNVNVDVQLCLFSPHDAWYFS